MTPVEARRQALVALGGLESTKEAYRDRRGPAGLESLLRDLRYGLRTLRKSPGFAAAGIVILGLGIGVNSAIFTVVNAVVLRPLPFADADRIVRLWHTPPQSTFPRHADFRALPRQLPRLGSAEHVVCGHGHLPRRPADADRARRTDGGAEPAGLGEFPADLRPAATDRPRLHRRGRPRGQHADGAAERSLLADPLRQRPDDSRPADPAQPHGVHGDRRGAGAVVPRGGAGLDAAALAAPPTAPSAPITTTAPWPS